MSLFYKDQRLSTTLKEEGDMNNLPEFYSLFFQDSLELLTKIHRNKPSMFQTFPCLDILTQPSFRLTFHNIVRVKNITIS